jgi:VWFA-related protein
MKTRPCGVLSPHTLIAALLFILLIYAMPLAAAGAAGPPHDRPGPRHELDPGSAAWLEEVAPLITARERAVFLELPGESERQAFVRRFWQVRDPHGSTLRNELEERWASRLPEARRRWGTLRDDRARAFLLHGDPTTRIESVCAAAAPRFEVWIYEAGFQVKYRTAFVLAAAPGGGEAKIWHPGGAIEGPPEDAATACTNGARLAQEARWIRLLGAENYRAVVERALTGPRPQPADWVVTFVPFTTAVPEGAPILRAGLEVEFPGQVDGKTVLRGFLVLEPEPQMTGERELLLSGEVLRGDAPLDAFRYRFVVQPGAGDGGPVPLAFERFLPAGPCHLVVRLEELQAGTFFRDELDLEVPGPGDAGPMPLDLEPAAETAVAALAPTAPPAPVDALVPAVLTAADRGGALRAAPAAPSAEIATLYAEATAALTAREPDVRLVAPRGLLSGPVRFEARLEGDAGAVAGGQIDRVTFLLDGRPVVTRNRPPYAVRLDLGPVPRPHRLAAHGLSRDGRVLAHDELAVNEGAQQFRVRLLEPRAGRSFARSLRARVDVDPPAGRSVERVELFLDEGRIATLYQPPFVHPVALPRGGAVSYVRAVAYLADGSAAEDLVLLNVPEQGVSDAIDVRLVELYATVLDRAGRPIEGLAANRFRVVEDGVPQRLQRVERVTDTPIEAAILIDTSGSMRHHMPAVREAALQFLRQTLRPADEAALITFNRAPRVAVGLTSDLDTLAEGLSGLVAEDRTSLYDSLVYALHYLAGAKGQRTVLLLSDGVDKGSRFGYEQALESARRAGVAIYTIGIDLEGGQGSDAAKKLTRFAAETGGRSYFLAGTDGLPAVYRAIERELRAQYRIAYQSSNSSVDDQFRLVEVQLPGTELEPRTISGYYP